MKRVVISPTAAGQWLYTVYVDERVVVVGVSETREAAETQASLA